MRFVSLSLSPSLPLISSSIGSIGFDWLRFCCRSFVVCIRTGRFVSYPSDWFDWFLIFFLSFLVCVFVVVMIGSVPGLLVWCVRFDFQSFHQTVCSLLFIIIGSIGLLIGFHFIQQVCPLWSVLWSVRFCPWSRRSDQLAIFVGRFGFLQMSSAASRLVPLARLVCLLQPNGRFHGLLCLFRFRLISNLAFSPFPVVSSALDSCIAHSGRFLIVRLVIARFRFGFIEWFVHLFCDLFLSIRLID